MKLYAEDFSDKFEKNIYFISCISEFGLNHGTSFVGHDGFLTTEYQKHHELFPNLLEIEMETQAYDDDFLLMLKECKMFKYEKSALNFVEKRNNHYTGPKNLSDYWTYKVIEITCDGCEYFEKFTGVYDKNSHILFHTEMGSHAFAIRVPLWMYLLNDVITEKNYEAYSNQIIKIKKLMVRHFIEEELNKNKKDYKWIYAKKEVIEKAIEELSYLDFKKLINDFFTPKNINGYEFFPAIPECFFEKCDKYIAKSLVLKSEANVMGGKYDYKYHT